MEYLTAIEISKLWNISSRMVAYYCETGRIAGAVKKGKTWFIPSRAGKPADKRRSRKKVKPAEDNIMQTEPVTEMETADTDVFEALVVALEAEIKAELAGKDDEFRIEMKKGKKAENVCVCSRDLLRLAAFLQAVPNGVQAMSAHMPGLVETSLNL